MGLIERIDMYLQEDQWSGEVKTKRHPPEGLFKEGSAEKIASWCAGSGSLNTAMAELNFYINRAGDNLSADRLGVLNHAKELVQKKFNKEED